MNDHIRLLLELSNKINSKAISLTRMLILSLLNYFKDGLQYRQLKTALNISDGKLYANLERMIEMGYIEKSLVEIGNKELTTFFITPKGRNELSKIVELMNILLKIEKESLGVEDDKSNR